MPLSSPDITTRDFLIEINGELNGTGVSTLAQYADDAGAAAGGVPVGGLYINSGTGSVQARLV